MQELFTALESNNLEDFTLLVEDNLNFLTATDIDGWDLLALSVHYAMPQYTNLLLDKLTEKEILESKPQHPLRIAFQNKDWDSATNLLSNEKINADLLFKNNESSLFLAIYLKQKPLIDKLITKKANPFITNKQNISPIMLSIENSDYPLFEIFAQHIDFEKKYNDNWLKYSIKSGNKKIFDYLLPYFKGNPDEIFDIAVGFQKIEIIDSIINIDNFIPGTEQIVHIVDIMCKPYYTTFEQQACKKLADFLFDINIPFQQFVNKNGQNAWMLAIKNDNEIIFNRLINETKETVNFPDENQQTPLMYAIEKDNLSYVESLLKRNANPNFQDSHKNTPLIKAVKRKNLPIVEALLKKSVHINELNEYNENALSIAIQMKRIDLFTALIWAGGEITTNPAKFIKQNEYYQLNSMGSVEKTSLGVEEKQINDFIALMQLGFKLNSTNSSGDTLLLHFIKKGYLANYYALIKCLKDGNQKDKENNSALMCAMNKPNDEYSLSLMLRFPELDLSIVNNNEQNVYDCCIRNGSIKRLERLLRYDPKLNKENAKKSLIFLSEHGDLTNSLAIIKNALPNFEKLKDSDDNTLLMLATLGNKPDNFQFLMNQEKVNFSSAHMNKQNQNLAQLIQKLDDISISQFTNVMSHYIAKNKKKL